MKRIQDGNQLSRGCARWGARWAVPRCRGGLEGRRAGRGVAKAGLTREAVPSSEVDGIARYATERPNQLTPACASLMASDPLTMNRRARGWHRRALTLLTLLASL